MRELSTRNLCEKSVDKLEKILGSSLLIVGLPPKVKLHNWGWYWRLFSLGRARP